MAQSLIFTSSAAATLFNSVAGAWFVFEAVMNVRQRLRAGRGRRLDPTFVLFYLCIAASVVVSQVLGRRGHLLWPGGLIWPLVTGVVLIAACIALRAWSIITLGRFFQYQIRIQSGHQVVTSGPYRFVRHPSYTGIILGALGYALGTDDVYSLAAAAVLTGLGLTVRIHAEERQLQEALGADYDEFAAHRKRLVPGVF